MSSRYGAVFHRSAAFAASRTVYYTHEGHTVEVNNRTGWYLHTMHFFQQVSGGCIKATSSNIHTA